jgi:hypothetical protein
VEHDLVERLQRMGRVVHALGERREPEPVDEPHLLDHLLEAHAHVLVLRKLAADHQSELDVLHREPLWKNFQDNRFRLARRSPFSQTSGPVRSMRRKCS